MGEVSRVVEEGPCWDAHVCLAVAVKKRKTGGE